MDLAPLLEVAKRAARIGGDLVREADHRTPAEAKGAGDYVTAADYASERAIAEVLSAANPSISVVGEESGGEGGSRYWLVDPLDGTTNFLHGFPVIGVSIALIERGRPVIGVVHAPFQEETYYAVRGNGATLATRSGTAPLRVSSRPPERAIVATGFPFRKKSLLPRHLEAVRLCLERFEDLRRPGAASLDLAWVATGIFEGFFELNLSPWDVAAGALLVEEAGGVVSNWDGGPGYLSGDILAGSPVVHAQLAKIARRAGA